jgi:hypothetical protein
MATYTAHFINLLDRFHVPNNLIRLNSIWMRFHEGLVFLCSGRSALTALVLIPLSLIDEGVDGQSLHFAVVLGCESTAAIDLC